MSVLLAILAGLSIYLIVLGWVEMHNIPPSRQRVNRLFAELGENSENEISRRKSGASALVQRLHQWAEKLGEAFPHYQSFVQPGNLEQRIMWAGKQREISPAQLYGWQLLGLLAGIGFAMYLKLTVIGWAIALPLMIVAAIMGLWAPILWVDGEANKRQRRIELELPDIIELLATTVDAGANFVQALDSVHQRMPEGPLREELGLLCDEIEFGAPMAEALTRLAMRNRVTSIQMFVGALIQGHELGVPIAETLRVQAEVGRDERIQRAREAVGKAIPKITLVTTLLIVPFVLCLVLAVVAFTFWRDMGPLLSDFFSQ